MSCIERRQGRHRTSWLGLGLAALLAGCANAPRPAPAVPAPPPPPPAPSAAQLPPAPPLAAGDKVPLLAAPKPSRTLDELRRQAALRLVAANPDRTYMSEPPAVLLAIPVIEVELYNDGRIKRLHVLRKPGQAPETVQIAIDAIQRAAPFGDVSRMPEPHKFTETFLFDNTLRFKPRTLD